MIYELLAITFSFQSSTIPIARIDFWKVWIGNVFTSRQNPTRERYLFCRILFRRYITLCTSGKRDWWIHNFIFDTVLGRGNQTLSARAILITKITIFSQAVRFSFFAHSKFFGLETCEQDQSLFNYYSIQYNLIYFSPKHFLNKFTTSSYTLAPVMWPFAKTKTGFILDGST